MEFQEVHKLFFDCERGTFSEVTERENFDSQITLDKDEKKLFVDFFGSSNILHGNRATNPKLASKKFLLYPEMNSLDLNLLFPKHDKPELRLYISKDHGFKPEGGNIWFSYINRSSQLVIGTLPAEKWNSIRPPKSKSDTLASDKSDLVDFVDNDQYEVRQHSFEPGAMSIIQMGQELIGHPTTAINELVKNGYDADATSCKVYFHFDKNPDKSFAVIFDNGSGMNDRVLFGNWLQPSVSSKREGSAKSEIYKRSLLGSKGIGRLAAMALGKSVTVITKQESEKKYNWITVNREKFTAKKLLSQIKFPGDKVKKAGSVFSNESILKERGISRNTIVYDFLLNNQLQSFANGTLIVVERLDDSVLKILYQDFLVDTEQLQYEQFSYKSTEFYKGLATLITPVSLNEEILEELINDKVIRKTKKNAEPEGDFNMELGTNLLPDQNKNEVDWLPVAPIPIHSTFDYRIYGKVNKEGMVKGHFIYNRLEDDYKEENLEIPANEMRDEGEQLNLFGKNPTARVGGYYFDIRVYDMGENDNVEKLAVNSGFDNKSQFKSAFKSFQGLRVSKNGFGVKPYGEEVEDWIGLSKERVQDPGHNVNTNQILGYVFLFSPENDALEEKTNREGFLENTAFIQLRNDLRKIFKTLGVLRYNYRVRHSLGRIPKSRHSRPDFEAYLEYVKANSNLDQIRKYSEGFIEEVTTSMDNLEESLSFSERLASLGSGIELIYHEIGQPISGLRTTKSSLDLKKKKVQPELLDGFIKDINSLEHFTDVLVELRKALQPAIGRTRKRSFIPYQTFLKVCNLYKSDIEEYKIAIVADKRLNDFEISDLEFAFWIAFLNIINNAIYWIKKSGKSGQEIRLLKGKDSFIISNSGPFIREDLIEHIFEYGVTTRTEKNATGLGLAFTQSILGRNDWSIHAENKKDGPAFIIKKQSSE